MQVAIVVGCIIVGGVLSLGISVALVLSVFFNYIGKVIRDDNREE